MCSYIPVSEGGFCGGMGGGGLRECGQTPNTSSGSDNQK